MLNDRQKRVLKDLETSDILVTAKMLAAKQHVSLRTIRNDINEISRYVDENGAQFVKLPGQGMKIISEINLSSHFNEAHLMKNFPIASTNERMFLMSLEFLFCENPISINSLCDHFQVSRGTVISVIHSINELLESYSLNLKGYKNKGYYLEGTTRNQEAFLNDIISLFGEESVCRTLMFTGNQYLIQKDVEMINDFMDFISNHLFLYINHYYFFITMIYRVICEATYNNHEKQEFLSIQEARINKLILFLKEKYNIEFSKEETSRIIHIINSCTDICDSYGKKGFDEKLPIAVDAMIEYVQNSGMYTINDVENLKTDLLVHMTSVFKSKNEGYLKDNPMLEDIKASYPNEFQLIKSSAKAFRRIHAYSFSEDEIGYLTLYFLRSFEKTKRIQETKIMVVCNTGRSASKLLSTRLMNNLPDIHIVAMDSAYNITAHKNTLDNIDFVISTIPIKDITKPYIVISPLLSEEEIEKVKDAIWISKRQDNTGESLSKAAENYANQYEKFKAADRFIRKIDYSSSSISKKSIVPVESTDIFGEVVMDLWQMLAKLYPNKITEKQYDNVTGIFAHVMMSIPRWQRGKFIEPMDYDEMVRDHQKECEIIQAFLDRVSKTLGVFITPAEVVAILRYYIY